jgi:hypothetical protein
MKRTLLSLVALTLLVATSCKKDEEVTTTGSSLASSATIQGIVKADTDITNASPELKSGAIILAKYNKADLILNPQPGVTYPDVVISATTNSSGQYSFTIPTAGKPVTVEIIPQDFKQDVITGPSTSNSDVLFMDGGTTLTVIEKEVKLYDINY